MLVFKPKRSSGGAWYLACFGMDPGVSKEYVTASEIFNWRRGQMIEHAQFLKFAVFVSQESAKISKGGSSIPFGKMTFAMNLRYF